MKVLFSAPILPKTVGKARIDDWVTRDTAPVDGIDWNGNGKLDAEAYKFPTYYGKDGGTVNGGTGAKASEPAILSPSLDQLKAHAQELGVEVLGREHLPNGVFVGEASPEGIQNFRPIETLVYQATPKINPRATWGIDTVNNQFLVYEK
ncbi:MAG: hypothetical protein J0I12_10965 [Candidatus Eremiobacteraeota bacterium]|nr:hypothetical protein [Candidatus Eremiobacteraeota bacterium]